MKSVLSLLLITANLLAACAQKKDWLIDDKAHFDRLSTQPLYQKYGQVQSIKIVYDTKFEKLHVIASKRYEYHFEYCQEVLGYFGSLGTFNRESYSGDSTRRFLLGNINYYGALDKFTLELGPSDRMTGEQLKVMFNSLKKKVYFGDNLYVMLNTTHVSGLSISLGDEIPTLSADEVYKGQKYQPISKRVSKGRFVVIDNWEKQCDDIRPTDILLIDDIPEVFPLVQGIIVTTFQTPLSHVSILGQNRKIPVCAYRGAFSLKSLLDLNGKTVEFQVEQDTFVVRYKKIDLSKLIKQGKVIHLKKNLEVDSLVPIQYASERWSSSIGNKASNFSELHKFSVLMDFKTPESAFAVPFYFYEKHLTKSGDARTKINSLIAKNNLARSRKEIEKDLNEIRELILSEKIDPKLLKEVEEMIASLGNFKRMRFRSSTNAEDKKGFSGAGLYSSKTGEIGNDDKPIDLAIKTVWASMWSYGAFIEREAFNMRHEDASMGILVHRSFPEEEVNGVAITTNLYREHYLGFVVNAQVGDVSVVNPDPGVKCDQFICYPTESGQSFNNKRGGIDVINYSSLNEGKLVMTDDEIQNLADVLEKIKRKYVRTHYTGMDYYDFALDLEFKLDRETRQLYIKQMRIFNH